MKVLITLAAFIFSSQIALAHEEHGNFLELIGADAEHSEHQEWTVYACTKANQAQLDYIDQGNRKKDVFLDSCAENTGNSVWCDQLTRANPSSKNTFTCTYGSNQPHLLIHPDEQTWKYAFQAVRLVEGLEDLDIQVCEIYNWWRPEPYNKNVSGAPGRHPYGTSVDVRFCSQRDKDRAHNVLCEWRRQGALRALGYYAGTGLHLGIGDTVGNTWNKSCD